MIPQIIKNQSFQNIGYYFASNIVKTIIPFLILPIITHYLTPSEYGTWQVYLTLLGLTVPVTALGLNMIVGREYHLRNRQEHAKCVYQSIIMIAISNLIFLLSIFLYGYFNDELMSISVKYLYFLPFLCFFLNIQAINKIILRHEKRAKLFSVIDTAYSALFSFSSIALIYFVSISWQAILSANIITTTLFFIVSMSIVIKERKIIIAWDTIKAKSLLLLSLPLVPHAIGGQILNISDRLILERMTNTAQVGHYSIGASLGVAVLLFCTAFNNSWGPWMHKQLRDLTEKKKFKIIHYTYLYFIATFVITFIVGLVAQFYILFLISDEYHAAIPVAWWIAGGSAFYGMTLAINHYLIILGETKILPILTGTAAILNIILTIWLIKKNGTVGAAQSTLISYAVLFVIMLWQVQKNMPMPWIRALKEIKIAK
jgi:O-antigen/teichoic acid export membrane protein